MADNIAKLRLYPDQYNPEMMTDENSLANALLTQPDKITPVLTHLAGREDKKFPLSYTTEGANRVVDVNDIEYDWPVIGRLDKVISTSQTLYTSTDKPGIGFSQFNAIFSERWFVNKALIESPELNVQARVQGDPVRVAGGWKYTLELADAMDASDYCPPEELSPGKQWGALFNPVAASGSTGTDAPWTAPSKMRNQITHMRFGYNYEGNMPNRTVNVQFNIPGKGMTDLWMPFEEWQHSLKFREHRENHFWYSRYNRTPEGIVHLKDDNGKPVPIGSGVLEQIPNFDTYAELTASKLKNIVGDTFYGATDSQNMSVILYTGLGGLEEFDNAMKKEMLANNYERSVGGKFVTGSGRAMQLGGFFVTYQHVDGHSVTVRHLPLFDYGVRAQKSPKHPKTGYPLESYRMVFLDQSMYEGKPNVVMTSQKGRRMVRAVVPGIAPLPASFSGNKTEFRAHDKDALSVHYLTAAGIMIRRATNCMNLECVAQ